MPLGREMAGMRRHTSASRVVFVVALTLTGAGAGVAAALATSGSGLIRAAGGAAGGAAGLCSATWAEAAKQRRETAEAAARERDQVLDPVISEPAHDLSVLGLLLPTRESAAPFRGRAADLAWLRAWADNPGGHPAALVTGPGGVGKTRLAVQFAATRPPPWAAGWLHPGRGASALDAVRACEDPALILVDDADTHPDTAALLTSLASAPRPASARVLLITRTADALAQVTGQLPEQARWILAPENLPARPLGLFGSSDDHARWFGEAVRAYAAARRTPPPDLPAVTGAANSDQADDPVLTIQAQALLAVLETERSRPQHPDAQTLPFGQVAEALFAHEQRRWEQVAQQPGWGLADLTAPVQERAIAVLMLSGAAAEPEAITALRAMPDLADATAERLARIARWAFHLYPPGPVRIQPDLLAEWFLTTQLTAASGLAAHLNDLARHNLVALLALLARASDHMPAAVPLYARLIQADPVSLAAVGADAALTARVARPLLDAALAALVTSVSLTPGTLADLYRHLPEGTLPRTRAAVFAVTVDHARETGTREDLANALTRYGASLRDLGQPREALAAFEEALALYRDLAAADPAHQLSVAYALTGTGISLAELGRHREALAAREEAVGLYRGLAVADSAHLPSLAAALGNGGNSLAALGRHREALAAKEEALALVRDLAAADSAHQPELAAGLTSTGSTLADLGRPREALAAEEEALALYRDLAAANPAHQPNLAKALTNTGSSLRLLGRHGEALAALEESLALYRGLAAANPAHQPSVAYALIGTGISLAELGRHREALAAFEESLALYRDLAGANPAHQPDLAKALTGTGIILKGLGRHREALAAFEESLALYRDLAAANPAHQTDLVEVLTNYGTSLRAQGRHSEALTYDREVLEIYALLARSDPEVYEKTYQHHLARLRRTYDLRGDRSTSISLHLRRDNQAATSNGNPINEGTTEEM
jgi:tetratricopeptide (TPR) repeat protein